MDLQSLISILDKQETNLKKLQNIVTIKKEVLVSNNYEKLNDVIAEEEQSLLSIQLTEEERLLAMHELFRKYNIDNERYKLEILVTALVNKENPELLEQITSLEKRIKNTIEIVTNVNHLNMVLIQQSRSLINETIQAVINHGTKSILDRKG